MFALVCERLPAERGSQPGRAAALLRCAAHHSSPAQLPSISSQERVYLSAVLLRHAHVEGMHVLEATLRLVLSETVPVPQGTMPYQIPASVPHLPPPVPMGMAMPASPHAGLPREQLASTRGKSNAKQSTGGPVAEAAPDGPTALMATLGHLLFTL